MRTSTTRYLNAEYDERWQLRDLESFQRRVLVCLVLFLGHPVELVQDAEQRHLRNDVFPHLVWIQRRRWQVARQVHERCVLHLLCTQ